MPLFWGYSKGLPRMKDGCLESRMHFRNTFLQSLEGKASMLPTLCYLPIFPRGSLPHPAPHLADESIFSIARRSMIHSPCHDPVTCGIQSKHSYWGFSTINEQPPASCNSPTHEMQQFKAFFSLCRSPLPSSIHSQKGQSWAKPVTHNFTFPPKLSLEESVEAWTRSFLVYITSPNASWITLLVIFRRKLNPHLLQETALILVIPSPIQR